MLRKNVFILINNQLLSTANTKDINTDSYIKSNERSEDSYIGLADFFLFFFQEKVLKFVHAQF